MAERLLLVESDSTLCGQLSRFLTTLGYQVDAVESVGAALAALRAAPPALTLLDAQLDEDPATVAFATRQCDAGLVIMGRPEVADALVIDIGVEVAPDSVLHKPFTAQGLSDMVRATLKERGEKAEAERVRAKASSELDAQLGALQAALGELTGMRASATPGEPSDAIRAEDLRAALEESAPPELSGAHDPSASNELSAALGLSGAPAPDAAPAEPPAAASHDLLAADPRAAAAEGSLDQPPAEPARAEEASLPSRSLGPLLEASALPTPPLESMELVSRYALQPMVAADPLDPRGIYGLVTMPELLYFCFRDLFSGWLLLRRGAVTKTILLRGGRPVFAQSNIKAETLGTMLVSAGKLSPEDSERSLRYADALGIRQGEAIVRLGMLSEEGLRDGLRVQLITRLTNCFSWTDAEYGLTYDPDAKESADAAEVNPLVVIFEGVKTRYPIGPLMAHYDQLIRQAPRTTDRLSDYATMLRGYRDELAVVERCDGTRALGEVLATSPFGLISTLRIMRALESMNCLSYGAVVSSTVSPRATAGATRRSGARTSGPLRSVRRSGAEPSGAQASRRPDERTATGSHRTVRPDERLTSGSHRTVRPDDRTTTGAHRVLRPTGAHAAGIRKARTRRPGVESDTAGPASRGPAPRASGSRAPVSRGPASRAPASHGARSRGAAAVPAARTTGSRGVVPEQVEPETPVAMLDRLEAAGHSYALLGVSLTANRAAISKAASSLMRGLTHLTTHADAELARRARAVFMVVKKAGEVLTNPQRRRAYDALNLPIPPATGTDLVAAESDFKLGRICMASNAMERARSYFERAAHQDRHQAIYQVFLAWATFSLASDRDRRVRTQAVELAREALKSDSSRDDGHVLLGRMYQAMANHDQAVRAFNKALEINSGNVDARTGLTQLEADQTETKKDTGLFGGLFTRR